MIAQVVQTTVIMLLVKTASAGTMQFAVENEALVFATSQQVFEAWYAESVRHGERDPDLSIEVHVVNYKIGIGAKSKMIEMETLGSERMTTLGWRFFCVTLYVNVIYHMWC